MSVTTWNRLEPAAEFADPHAGAERALAARVADPLWLLARQHQLGELRGEDAGTPVAAAIELATHPMVAIVIGGVAHPMPTGVPLEALVEPEPIAVDVRARGRGGELLVELLLEHGLPRLVDAVRTAFPWAAMAPDQPGAALARLAARRWADGATIARATAWTTALGARPDEVSALAQVEAAWRAWWAGTVGPVDRDAWSSEHLGYEFAVRAPDGDASLELVAVDYRGGRLDWDAFDLRRGPAVSGGRASMRRHRGVPSPLSIAGMPVVRFWEQEDPRFDPSQVSVGPGDLGRALLVETALTYASDWFVVPLVLEHGALHRVASMTVIDTFGVAALVAPVEAVRPGDWALWRVGPQAQMAAPYLVLPTVTTSTLESAPVEDVALVRDELANLVWAIERVVPDGRGGGRPVARPEPAPPEAVAGGADLRYQPLPRVPQDRVPLLKVDDPRGPRLVRALAIDPALALPATEGVLIGSSFATRDDAIGRAGVVIERRWQLAIDGAGQRWVWRTRRRIPGAHQPTVAVAADVLIPRPS